MPDTPPTDTALIAPCGMNCSVCSRYLARKYDVRRTGVSMAYCAGCRPRDKKCAFLKKRCKLLLSQSVLFCFQCPTFPCRNLERIDARYQKHYRISLIENLTFIKRHSLAALMQRESTKWQCLHCGGVLCCHNGLCFNCSADRLQLKKKLYRWEDE